MIDDFTPNEILDIELAGVLAGPRLQDALALLTGFGRQQIEDEIDEAVSSVEMEAENARREFEEKIDELEQRNREVVAEFANDAADDLDSMIDPIETLLAETALADTPTGRKIKQLLQTIRVYTTEMSLPPS